MMILAYFSPEVVLPLTSVVAAVFGVIVMIGGAPFRFAARAFRAAFGKKEERPKEPTEAPPDPQAP
jgi:hypothetical protein